MSNEATRPAETESRSPFERRFAWQGGAIAGLIATIAMGIAITIMDLETLRLSIAGLYGQEGNLVIGWGAHLLHGILFGVLFAVILADPGLYRVTSSVWKTIGGGVVYGLVLSVVAAGIIMPLWLDAVGVSELGSVPSITRSSFAWRLLYGIVLGALFPLLEGR